MNFKPRASESASHPQRHSWVGPTLPSLAHANILQVRTSPRITNPSRPTHSALSEVLRLRPYQSLWASPEFVPSCLLISCHLESLGHCFLECSVNSEST